MIPIFYYYLKCLHLFRTKSKLKSQKSVSESKVSCGVVMPFEDAKILKCNQCWKSDKTPSIIYADLASLIKKVDGCKTPR